MSWNDIVVVESMGTFAVYLFFTLSGLTMMMVYSERFADGIAPEPLRSFFRNRLARLLPLLLLVALLTYIKQEITGTGDAIAALLTGTGLMALHMPGFLSNSIGAWSLGIELVFYAVFPIVAVLARTWKTVAAWTVGLVIAQHCLLAKIATVDNHWHYYISALTFAPFFGLGILAWFDRGKRTQGSLALALIGLALILGYSLAFPTDLMRDQASYLILTMGVALVIWAAWRGKMPAWAAKPAGFLGEISYSLYLTHWIANDIARVVGLPLHLQWAAFTALSIGGSYVSYRLFEDPMRKWLAHRWPTTISAPRYEAPSLP